MKKILLSLLLLCAVFFGRSQVVLNELYGQPNTGNIANVGQQYFELYNTGTTAVPLDCYAIVAYNASNSSFNVIDFPSNAVIQPKSYYVAAVGAGPYTYGPTTLTSANINLNWNMGITPLRVAGGSFKRYTRRTTAPIGYDTVSITNQNFFAYAPSNNRYSVFLFRYNPDNPGVATYVNGFVAQDGAAINQPGATLNISSFPDLTIEANAGNTCKYTIKWSDVKVAEFDNEATGNDHGYYRAGNALCGSWSKITSNTLATPGTQNPLTTNRDNSSGDLNTIETLACGSSQVAFQIQETPNVQFPIEVELYYDENNIGYLDAGEYQGSITNITSLPYTGAFNILPGKNVVLVYQTALGCISKVAKAIATSTGSLETKQLNVCGSQIDFSIPTATGNAAIYGFPIQVQLYEDDPVSGAIGTYNQGVDQPIGNPVTINSPTSALSSIPIPEDRRGKLYILVYTSRLNCYTKTVVPTPASGQLTTFEGYLCGNTVNFTIPTPTEPNNDAINYSLPIEVNVYKDVNEDGALLLEDTIGGKDLLGQKIVTSFSSAADIITLSESNQTIIIVYKTKYSCFTKVVTSPKVITASDIDMNGAIPTYNSTAFNYKFVSAHEGAYPLVLKVYEDVNDNGTIEENVDIVKATHNFSSASDVNQNGYSVTVAPTSSGILQATSVTGCVLDNYIAPRPEEILPVKLVSFNAKRAKEKVALTWQTAMEVNNSGFDIQRKLANGEWKTIAFMFSKANDGNSNSMLSYEYTDINSAKGVSQYRLRQVDIDTRSTFSEVRSVHGLEQASRLLVYPNPSADGKVSVVFDDQQGSRNIMVSDMAGRVVKQYRNITDNSLQIDNLQNGIYTLKIINVNTGETTVEKLIIKKR